MHALTLENVSFIGYARLLLLSKLDFQHFKNARLCKYNSHNLHSVKYRAEHACISYMQHAPICLCLNYTAPRNTLTPPRWVNKTGIAVVKMTVPRVAVALRWMLQIHAIISLIACIHAICMSMR